MANNLALLPDGKKVFFVSDLHLGSPNSEKSLERETFMVKWLDSIRQEALSIFFVGDIFDFWFEYKYVVPKGFVRFLGKVSQLQQDGITIHFFTGNHDMWMFDYFPKEMGIPIYRSNLELDIDGTKVLVGHGDGLGDGDSGYKFIKSIFGNPFCQWLFARIHPNLGFRMANYWSMKSRNSEKRDIPEDKDRLIKYCSEVEKNHHHDYYVFGHRHQPNTIIISDNSTYINLGDWIDHFTYAEFASGKLVLKKFESAI